jgi:hypothetical protein
MQFTFIGGLNKTGANFNLLIEGWDSENPTIIDTQEQRFTVQNNGIEFGDVTCSSDFIAEAEDEDEAVSEATLTEDATENAITTGMTDLANPLGISVTTFFIFIMIVITAGLWFEMAKRDFSGSSTLGAIMIFNFLMVILGARLDIFGVGLIITIVIVAIVIIGVALGKFLTGLGGNNG